MCTETAPKTEITPEDFSALAAAAVRDAQEVAQCETRDDAYEAVWELEIAACSALGFSPLTEDQAAVDAADEAQHVYWLKMRDALRAILGDLAGGAQTYLEEMESRPVTDICAGR
jgi:hypothetical protein